MPEAIGHQAPGRGAPARPHGDVLFPGIIDDIGHHQEIAGKAHLRQAVELVVQALPVGPPPAGAGGRPLGQAPGQPFPGLAVQLLLHGLGRWPPDRPGSGRCPGPGRRRSGRRSRRWRPGPFGGKDRAMSSGRLEIELVGLELHAPGGCSPFCRSGCTTKRHGPGHPRASGNGSRWWPPGGGPSWGASSSRASFTLCCSGSSLAWTSR